MSTLLEERPITQPPGDEDEEIFHIGCEECNPTEAWCGAYIGFTPGEDDDFIPPDEMICKMCKDFRDLYGGVCPECGE